MNRSLNTFAVATAAAGLILSSASAAGAATKAYNVGHAAPKGVHTTATGVSGWAVVDAGGTFARKLNAKTVSQDDTGSYIVGFNSNIRGCAYSGNVMLSGDTGVSDPGYVTFVGANGNSKGVYVQTFDATGNLSNGLGFSLIVTC